MPVTGVQTCALPISGGEPRPETGNEPGIESGPGPAAEFLPKPDIIPASPTPFVDRFGHLDEIDTTPREEPRSVPLAEVPDVIPNAASTPVWSLKGESSEPPKPAAKREIPIAEPAKPVAPEPIAAAEPKAKPIAAKPQAAAGPASPPKKGWWQRTFNSD